jgi:hypothetical protein
MPALVRYDSYLQVHYGILTSIKVTSPAHGYLIWAESEGIRHIQSLRRTIMKRTLIYTAVVAALLPVMVSVANAADKDQTRDQDRRQTQDKTQDQVYGSQLMTQQERSEYGARMRAAKTAEEREQIRKEHHEQMKARAKEKGVTLPDEPPARGMGGGMGSGGGMGGGSRRY